MGERERTPQPPGGRETSQAGSTYFERIIWQIIYSLPATLHPPSDAVDHLEWR
jgi:hypothetical protein